MDRRHMLKLATAATLFPDFSRDGFAETPSPAAGADGWISLLNGNDLSGWYSVLHRSGRGAAERMHYVTMEEEMLHVMGIEQGSEPAEAGYLATNTEFENVHIRVEYKWGMKRFAPRLVAKRDNGLLYGLVGQDTVWPTCVECQIEEGDVGDFFLLGGARGVQEPHGFGLSGVDMTFNGWPQSAAPPKDQAQPTGERKVKDGDFEILDGWNTVEVIWQGDRAAHIVNGRAVNVCSRLQYPDPANPDRYVPLTGGKIAIEIEFAEIWYRRIEVKKLA
jgi:Domain of Unknown Function (DUF1080)